MGLPFPLPSPVFATLDLRSQRDVPAAVAHAHAHGATVHGHLDVALSHSWIVPVRTMCGLVGLPLPVHHLSRRPPVLPSFPPPSLPRTPVLRCCPIPHLHC